MRVKLVAQPLYVQGFSVRINLPTATFLLTLLASVGLIVWVIQRVEHRAAADGGAVTGWQQTDTPPDAATPGDPWLDLPDAWTEAAIPTADVIAPAAATAATPGEVIPAAADGLVIFAGMRGEMRAVILAHRAPDGTRFESIYAPLVSTPLTTGDLIGRGMPVGRLSEGARIPVFPSIPADIAETGAGNSPLADALMSDDPQAWRTLEIGNAEKLLELMENPEH